MSFRYVVSVDPGDKNNGFCFFKYNTEAKTADTLIMDILTPKLLSQRLNQIYLGSQVDGFDSKSWNFVVENFRVDSNVRGAMFQWNEVSTAKMIGRVEFVAEAMDAPIILQEPANVLPMARKWAKPAFGKKMEANHLKDDISAWCHGVHFMMKRNWIGTTDQVTIRGQERL